MLGSRTKKVNSYGKRSQRIINVYDDNAYTSSAGSSTASIFDDMPPTRWAPVASKMKNRENQVTKKPKPVASKPIPVNRKKKQQSPVAHSLRHMVMRTQDTAHGTPSRVPFAVREHNTPRSPAVLGLGRKKGRIPSVKGTPLHKPKSPVVEMDIIVLDDDGNKISHERRISGGRNGDNVKKPSRKSKLPDNEIEEVAQPIRKPKRTMKRANPVIVISDESSDEDDLPPPSPVPKPQKKVASKRLPPAVTPVAPPPKQHFTRVEVIIPPPSPPLAALIKSTAPPISPEKPISFSPPPQTQYKHTLSPLIKSRQLTPYRSRQRKLFEPPSPPSPLTDSDLDLSIDLSDPSIGLHIPDNVSFQEKPVIPEYLVPLLEECQQGSCGLHEFSAFIETFPYDPVVRRYSQNVPGTYKFRKVGEASYSEVYGIGDVVLKVIPIRNEDELNDSGVGNNASARSSLKARMSDSSYGAQDGPPPSDAKDVLKEIIVTRAMGDVCDNFVRLLKTYVVRGRYPQLLLELWDEYLEKNGSESVRPDTFNVSQVYAIIVLPNGGPDLETYTFSHPSKTGWRQACSIFWQVTKSLAHAEQLVSFEHRDLHWGQILVKNLPMPVVMPMQEHNMNAMGHQRQKATIKAPMDDPVHGIQTTVIDLGLARMDAGDGAGGEMVHWTPFDEEIFLGEGDYQFDIYRLMKKHNNGKWQSFNPLTNVMWLHYLLLKLMRSKQLKTPAPPRKTTATAASTASAHATYFNERECYECLVDLEAWLGQCVNSISPKKATTSKNAGGGGKGRKKSQQQAHAQSTAAASTKASSSSGSPNPSCAGEIVEYGIKKGWVKAMAS
ncbi:hypothetical protein K435DRAFT_708012 [Dendrothele bispora CBS 962.96]|uniref:non-specific serine/threonine protein kinase n=1 Tax=Dendrothele bispora (strain CBS 962.96) TaxID=1314807 RepID=A0A4S8N0C6_DENBC|nr:hypothetical protein K435DRAFT_708012 [Dendrothele bispora CBS 962.96]